MKVFLKYIVRNMLEKKSRFFLLIISIAISTALLVGSAGIVDVIIDSFSEPYEAAREGQDISIMSGSEDPFIALESIDQTGLTDLRGELCTTGVITDGDRINYIQIHGRTAFSGNLTAGTTEFIQKTGSEAQPSCIISQRIADKKGLKPGDKLRFFLSGEETTFTVEAICGPEGIFASDQAENFTMMIPYGWLEQKLQADGKFNVITAKLTETDPSAETIRSFVSKYNVDHPELSAGILNNTEVYSDSSITLGLYFMMAIVVIVSGIIIYGVFKLVITERLSTIGTFMSQGATRKKVERIILMEGLMYALVAGAVGCVLGETLLFFVGRLTSPLAEYEIYPEFHINPIHILIGMIFAIVLSVFSAWLPVRSVRRLEAKDVILNRVEQRNGKVMAKRIIGAVLILFAASSFFLTGDAKANVAPFGFTAAFAGIILITPSIVKGASWLLARAFKNNATLYLTMNNIHSSKLLRNNIVLIVISLSSVLMIASFGKSMTDLVTDAYAKANYDYSISEILNGDPTTSTTDQIINKLKTLEGVKQETITPCYNAMGTSDNDASLIMLGVKPEGFGTTYDKYFEVSEKYQKEFDALENSRGREVLLPIKLQKQLKKNVGDTIDVTVNASTVPFKIIGIYDGKVYNAGLCILIRDEVLKQEFHIKEANMIYFAASGNNAEIENEMAPYLKSLGATWRTKAEDTKLNDEQNQQIVMIMSIFSYLAMIIASIGVFNNITICFIQRKREMAVMASVGMSKSGRMSLLLAESLASVAFSILLCIPLTILLSDLMTGFCSFIGLPMHVAFSWAELPIYAAIITGIILIASLSTMLKSRKLSVVQELKYE